MYALPPDRPPASTHQRSAVRPPLKWAGGKRWQLPHLKPYWAKFRDRRLVEPFCGGLAVTTGLSPRTALLNDINPHLVNFYRWLKRGLRIYFECKNDEAYYYYCRDRFNALLQDGQVASHEAAGLFYYLNRTGYNGLCRFNRSGQFNVPFGRYAKIGCRLNFLDYRAILRSCEFSRGDFQDLQIRNTDFIYADPPYDVKFTAYSSGGFNWDDQQRVAEWLSTHRGPVLLANQATPRIVTLYRSLGFGLTFLTAPRRISCTGDRSPTTEVLALRNLE